MCASETQSMRTNQPSLPIIRPNKSSSFFPLFALNFTMTVSIHVHLNFVKKIRY